MAIRKFAAVVIGASLLIGTAGCTFMTPIASQIGYTPADGSQANLATVKVRNFVYLTNGTKSVLTGSIINPGLEPKLLKIIYTDAFVDETKTVTFKVAAGEKIDLGYNGSKPLDIKLGGKSGGVVRLKVAEGSGKPIELRVPVLDETFDFYKSTVDSLGPRKSSGKDSTKTNPATNNSSNTESAH